MKLFITLFFCSLSHILLSQTSFEGTIEYQIITETPAGNNQTGHMTFKISGKNMMIIMNIPDAAGSRVIFNGSENSVYIIDDSAKSVIKLDLSDGGGNNRIGEVPDEYKQEYEKAIEDINNTPKTQNIRFEPTVESKIIAGYKCSKYRIKGGDGNTESYAWLTKDIPVNVPDNLDQGAGILSGLFSSEGFPLRIEKPEEANGQKQITILEAVSVRKISLDSKLFRIPEGYQVQDLMGIFKN